MGEARDGEFDFSLFDTIVQANVEHDTLRSDITELVEKIVDTLDDVDVGLAQTAEFYLDPEGAVSWDDDEDEEPLPSRPADELWSVTIGKYQDDIKRIDIQDPNILVLDDSLVTWVLEIYPPTAIKSGKPAYILSVNPLGSIEVGDHDKLGALFALADYIKDVKAITDDTENETILAFVVALHTALNQAILEEDFSQQTINHLLEAANKCMHDANEPVIACSSLEVEKTARANDISIEHTRLHHPENGKRIVLVEHDDIEAVEDDEIEAFCGDDFDAEDDRTEVSLYVEDLEGKLQLIRLRISLEGVVRVDAMDVATNSIYFSTNEVGNQDKTDMMRVVKDVLLEVIAGSRG